MSLESVFPQRLFPILGIWIKDTVLQTWIVVALLAAFAIWTHKKYRAWEPQTWQLLVEMIVEYVEGLVVSTVGRTLPQATAYLTTMISYIAIANLLGLFPLFQAPTRDLNTTLALSVVSLASTYVYAIQRRGLGGWLKSFLEPVFIMLPLNLLSHVSRVLSMSLRLFGNVIAGEIIGAVMFMLVPLLVPLPMNLLSSITGVLQALVFTVLTLVFVVDAMGLDQEPSAETQPS